MPDVCLGFEVHQPLRLNRNFREEIAEGKDIEDLFDVYFNNSWNKRILNRVATKCYLPANRLILENIDRFSKEKKKFKLAYSISGILLLQCEKWNPDVIDSFKRLAESDCVELLDQTFHHSLASLFSYEKEEFIEQVLMHRQLMKDLFGREPKVFENTEFLYNNSIARVLEKLGYRGIFAEGAERILGWRSPNYIYKSNGSNMKVFLRNYRVSDDIAFRFSARDWEEWPLTADKYASWLSATPGQCINIFIDYETFGEHQWPETGIYDFLSWLPGEILKYQNLQFVTPSELLAQEAVAEIDVNDFNSVSWADISRSTDAWLGNPMQQSCYRAIKGLKPYIKETRNEKILELWRLLQISDHLYYLYTTPGAPGIVHGYFSQQSPVAAFHAFTRVLSDFQKKVSKYLKGPRRELTYMSRILPPEKAFHFHQNGVYLGISAYSLDEFLEALEHVPDTSVQFHLQSGHFESWIKHVIGDEELANDLKEMRELGLPPEDLRKKFISRAHETLRHRNLMVKK
jgi:alpha-amylase